MKNHRKLKELLYFFDTLSHLSKDANEKKLSKATKKSDKDPIPVILSSDNGYSCFVATTGVSILYNTDTFIDFYIISDCISQNNKDKIHKSFLDVSDHFNITWLECDSAKEFSQIKLPVGYHVALNTLNRLLFPILAPQVERAIYLDIDLILMGDIKELWDENLGDNVIGAVPLLLRLIDYVHLRNAAKIDNQDYKYFNSGVMLIDYKRWREIEGGGENIVKKILDIISQVDTQVTPDECILNKYCESSGYTQLHSKYNAGPFVTYYKKLLRNKNKLFGEELHDFSEMSECIETYKLQNLLEIELPVVRHYFGADKPWSCVKGKYISEQIMSNFADFWKYAKMTRYFDYIKELFLEQYYTQDQVVSYVQTVKLFGFLPLYSIERSGRKTWIKLFAFLPIIKLKEKNVR